MKISCHKSATEFHFPLMGMVVLFMVIILSTVSTGKADTTEDLLPPLKTHSTKPLIGYVPIPRETINLVENEKKAGLSTSLLIEGAKSDPKFETALKKIGKNPKHLDAKDWFDVSKSIADLNSYHFTEWNQSMAREKGLAFIGPRFSVGAVDTELFQSEGPSTYKVKSAGKETEYIMVNYDAAKTLQTSYALLDSTDKRSGLQVQKDLLLVNAQMGSLPLLKKATQRSLGDVEFGEPQISSAKESKLVVPESIIAKNDVYLIHLAISLRNMDVGKIEQLSFNVQAPSGVLALELIPFRLEKDIKESHIVSSPQLKIEVKGVTVELGEFYRKEEVFNTRRSTLYAGGLLQNSFWWTLKEDAIQEGSHRFIVILQAPKGKDQVTLSLQVSAKTKGIFNYFQGDLLSTEPDLVGISLAKKR